MTKAFTPSADSLNRLERFAFYALEAGDMSAAEQAKREFYRNGVEDDCYHKDAD